MSEIFPIFSTKHLSEIQIKMFFSAFLVSMKVRYKGIFISIWHLTTQIKVHKENIKTKHETSEAYSKPCHTTKMELFTKILNGFQLLLSLLSKLLFTETYLEPSRTSKIELLAKTLEGFQLHTHQNNVIIRSCVYPFIICHSYLFLYCHVFLYTCFYY